MKTNAISVAVIATIALTLMGRETEGSSIVLTTEIGAGADTFVRSTFQDNDAADTNYGSTRLVQVKHDTILPGNNRKGYLRFDLASIVAPLADASLILTYAGTDPYPAANPSTYNVYGLKDGHVGEEWSETAITWNNAPGNDISSAGGVIAVDTTFLGSFQIDFNETDVGDAVSFGSGPLLDVLNSDTNDLVTFIITREERNWSDEVFASKEHETFAAPQLHVTPVPTPESILLLVIGALGTLVMRRSLLRGNDELS